MIIPPAAPCCDWCRVILPGCTPNSHDCEDTLHVCPLNSELLAAYEENIPEGPFTRIEVLQILRDFNHDLSGQPHPPN